MNNVLTNPVASVEARPARTGRLGNALGYLALGAVALSGALAIEGIDKRMSAAISATQELVGAGMQNTGPAAAPVRNNVTKLNRGAPTLEIK